MSYSIDRYVRPGVPPITSLVGLSQSEGYEFVARTVAEWEDGTNRFDGAGEVFLRARVEGHLVGICGLNRDPYLDDATVGRLRHLYVAPEHRRNGLARLLVQRCLAEAAPVFERVRLRTSNPAADALYQDSGFRVIEDPTATHEWRHPSRV